MTGSYARPWGDYRSARALCGQWTPECKEGLPRQASLCWVWLVSAAGCTTLSRCCWLSYTNVFISLSWCLEPTPLSEEHIGISHLPLYSAFPPATSIPVFPVQFKTANDDDACSDCFSEDWGHKIKFSEVTSTVSGGQWANSCRVSWFSPWAPLLWNVWC